MKILKDKKILDIKEAQPKDAKEIIEYTKQVGSETNMLTLDERGVNLTVEQEEKLLERIKTTPNVYFALGRVNGLLVSVATINGVSRDRLSHNVSLGMSVLKDYFNLGIGTHMLNHMISYCKITPEIKNIVLEVRADNQYAIKMYEKAGFKRCGKYSRMMKIDDQFYDCLIMEMLL